MTQTTQETSAAAPVPPARRPARRRGGGNVLVPVVLILFGIAVMLYPVAATFWNDYAQSRFALEYADDVQRTDPQTLDTDLARAHAYNAALSPQALLDPWTASSTSGEATQDNAAYADYQSQLNRFDAMARLRIPSIGVDLPVLHGTDDATLARGVGHLYGSTLPVGGEGTHAVLTAHSGLADATLFDALPQMQVGDVFYVDVYGETLAYQVDQRHVVLPEDLSALTREPGADRITLVTCTPRAVNTHRLLVQAVRIPGPQDALEQDGLLPGFSLDVQPWMYPRLIGAGVALLILLLLVTSSARKARRDRRRAAA